MVLHSDSFLGIIVPMVLMLAALGALVSSIVALAYRKYRITAKTAGITAASAALYVAGLTAAVQLSPQTIVNRGDSYCYDIWCIGVDGVSSQGTVAKLDVHIFSDANHVKVSMHGASLTLFDESGRRFRLIEDPAAIPFDAPLEPGQAIKTSLTFAAAPEARELFLLIGEPDNLPFLMRAFYSGVVAPKPALFRVL